MKRNVTDILREWFYRLPNGYAIEPYNDIELQVLSRILTENAIDPKPILRSPFESRRTGTFPRSTTSRSGIPRTATRPKTTVKC